MAVVARLSFIQIEMDKTLVNILLMVAALFNI